MARRKGEFIKEEQLVKLTKTGKPRCAMLLPKGRQCRNTAVDGSPYCAAHDPDVNERRKASCAKNSPVRHFQPGIPKEEREKLLTRERTIEIAAVIREHALDIAEIKFEELVKMSGEGEQDLFVGDYVQAVDLAMRANDSFHRIAEPQSQPNSGSTPVGGIVNIENLVINRLKLVREQLHAHGPDTLPAHPDPAAVEGVQDGAHSPR